MKMFELINELVSLPIVNEEVGSTLYFVTVDHDDFDSTPEIFFTRIRDANRQYKSTIAELEGLYDEDEADEILISIINCKFTGRKIASIEVTKRLIKEITGDDNALLSSLPNDELQELSTLMHRRGYDAALFLNTGVNNPMYATVESMIVFNPGQHIQIVSYFNE